MLKELVLAALNELPDDANIKEITEKIYIAEKIQKGLEDSENGNLISHNNVLKEIKAWT